MIWFVFIMSVGVVIVYSIGWGLTFFCWQTSSQREALVNVMLTSFYLWVLVCPICLFMIVLLRDTFNSARELWVTWYLMWGVFLLVVLLTKLGEGDVDFILKSLLLGLTVLTILMSVPLLMWWWGTLESAYLLLAVFLLLFFSSFWTVITYLSLVGPSKGGGDGTSSSSVSAASLQDKDDLDDLLGV